MTKSARNRSLDIKVVKLEGDDLPQSLHEAGYSACYVVMHGFTPKGGCFLSAEEAEAAADALHEQILGELRSTLGSVRGK
ncbi:hypothetical protein [Pseudomonas aeruginosa]|uniref:hypothetical protein n=1 Tax=Pseudomonas aeruginosa TaxID=287 RepID=UPI000FF1BB4C|nr:hypothetical protein [Pseudomonas aeruginosa]MXP71751.1 hypothetical protein [Pseudomonas aeruginosa]MXP89662.1 hypothetical protein [Pseudomonas aeruginosa]MXQ02981.1 hypothetical protein [Pseudomonas aeruginosa]MXQ16326.1 hypothetical protein [Pseudomonas aeruginosa]MXQ29662.1 hypothetical protein [Pseudomonas aeruginosa]